MKKLRSALLFVLLTFSCLSCDTIDEFKAKIDEAINQIAKTRKSLVLESMGWRSSIQTLEKNVSGDVSNVIREDLGDLTQNFVNSAGIELRCEMDFVESKIVAYLDALLKALQTIKGRVEKEGMLDESLETLLTNMIDARTLIVPTACQVDYKINFNLVGSKLQISDKDEARVIGFALRRPLNEYLVQLLDNKYNVIDSLPGDKCLSDPSAYMLIVNTESLPLSTSHAMIRILWKQSKLSEMSIKVVKPDITVTKPEFALLTIKLHSMTEKSDRVSLHVKFEVNSTAIKGADWSEFGRKDKLKKGVETKIQWLIKRVFDENDRYTVTLRMEDLGHKGKIVDSKNNYSTFNNLGLLYSKRGYELKDNKWVLYEYPKTIKTDWKGSIELTLTYKNQTKSFRPINFDFKKGYVNGSPEFAAEWQANGIPID